MFVTFFLDKVYVNEKLFTTFNHRCDVNDAKFFNIRGDLDIADVQYLEPQVNYMCFNVDFCTFVTWSVLKSRFNIRTFLTASRLPLKLMTM